jgi:hypothetical protein
MPDLGYAKTEQKEANSKRQAFCFSEKSQRGHESDRLQSYAGDDQEE